MVWKDKDGNELERHPGGRPVLYESASDMEVIIQKYFDDCAFTHKQTGEKIFRPTMSGLALELGMSRKSLVNYSHKSEFLLTIKKARQTVEQALEANLYTQTVAGTIFNLKNNFGWVDKSEVDSTHKIEVIELQTDFGD